jgi:PAS domain S-box-containing protein
MPSHRRLLRNGYVVGGFSTSVILFILWILKPSMEELGPPLLLFLPAVMLAAWYGTVRAGFFTALLSALASIYFLEKPFHSFHVAEPGEWVRVLLLVGMGGLMSFLISALRRAEARALERALRKQALLEAALRKQEDTDKAFRESQHLFEVLFQSVPDGLMVFDARGRIRCTNAELERLFGYTKEELLGKSVEILMPERFRRDYRQHWLRYFAAPYRRVLDSRLNLYGLRRDGAEFPVDIHLGPIESAQDALVVSIVRDITASKEAEARTRVRARQKALIADLGQLALAGIDLESLMEQFVARTAQCLEVEYAKILELLPDGQALLLKAGVGWKDGYAGQATVSAGLESQAGYTLLLSKPAKGTTLVAGEPVIVEDLNGETRFNGPPLLFEHGIVSGMSITIPGHGRPYGVLGVHTARRREFTQDDVEFLRTVTHLLALAIERQRAEEALRESEFRARCLVDANVIGVLEGVDGRILNANSIFLDMVGYSREDLLAGKLRWPEMTPPEYLPQDELIRNQLLEQGAAPPCEKEYFRKDGSRVPVLMGAALLKRSPLTWISFALDLSERKRLEDSLRQRAAELAEIDRRKDEFLAMLGHELRNPLAPIRNAVRILRRQCSSGPELQRLIEMIERQALHLTRLVDDLLDISRITRGKITLHKQPVDLAAIASHVIETHRPAVAARRHTLTVALPPGPLYLEGDEVRLAQVVDNLLTNAVKYSESGGQIHLTLDRAGDEAVLRVRDQGIGIPKESLPHIFEPFTQLDRGLDRAQGGLGIGLALVKRLVDLHGGHVDASSEGPGRGSEFMIRLPLFSRANG